MKKEVEKKVEAPKVQMVEMPMETFNKMADFITSQPYSKVFALVELIQESVKVK